MQKNMNYQTGNSWCYDNKESNCDIYGRLYNWQTALNVCPSGWHLPSDNEWTELGEYLGGNNEAGGKMKETGTDHWSSPNEKATNSSGFSALPGGRRERNGNFSYLSYYTSFWSSSENDRELAWGRSLLHELGKMMRYNYQYNKWYGYSCRCLRD